MISRIKQRYFSNTNLYMVMAAIVLLIIMSAAWFTMQQRTVSFNIRLNHLHNLQINSVQQLIYNAERQATMAAQIIASDQEIKQQLLLAGNQYQRHGESAELTSLRQQVMPLLDHYWQLLLPYAASQLHLHLTPDAHTFLRAHRPERHSDSLAEVRPMVMHSLNEGEVISGIELGRHGLGLRAVTPVKNNTGKVQAAVEVGLDLKRIFQQQQADFIDKRVVNDSVPIAIALLIKADLTSVLNADIHQPWFSNQYWSSRQPTAALQYWLANDMLPQQVNESTQLRLNFDDSQYLVSVLPLQIWGQTAEQTSQLVSLSWRNITPQIIKQQEANQIIWIIWLVATVVLLCLGMLLVSFLRHEAQQEVAEQQALLRQTEQKLSALYNLSPLPILLNRFDDGTFVESNPAMEQLVGYTPEELKQLSYWDLTPECFADAEQLQLKALNESGRYGPYIKQYRHKNGELIDIELNGVLFSDAQDEKYIWTIIKDIREIKRIEKLKDDFVSTVSHELRTPLTSISGSLGLVLGGACGVLSPKTEKLLGIAHKNSQRLNLLINDLLDIEKLVAGKMRFDEVTVALPRMLQEALEQHQPFAQQHNVRLTLNPVPDVMLWIDAARVQQVLANFLSNAVKFSPPQTEVVLGAEVQNQMVKIWVQDKGPGIALADQGQLFKRFSQLKQTGKQPKAGTGLGLAISREIALYSGGRVGVDSAVGEGASFWLELPLYQAPAHPELHEAILVVEDDEDTAMVLCEFLKSQHYIADWAPDSASAWQRLAKRHYAAITLDLQLHEESGADFFLRLRDNPVTANLPVLIISAFIEQGKLQLAAIANALDWLEKPVTPELLSLKLGRLLTELPYANRYQRILHVEDDNDIITIMRLQLANLCEYHAASSLDQARKMLQQQQFDLILLDLGLPDGNGMSLLSDITDCQGNIPVVIFSAQDVVVKNEQKVRAVFSKSRINTELLAKYLKNILN